MFDAVKEYGSQGEPQRKQREAPAALAEKESDSNPEEAAHEKPAGGMLGGAAKQVNAKKQNGWLDGGTTAGVSSALLEASQGKLEAGKNLGNE